MMKVFDAGDQYLDRYTIFPFLDSDDMQEACTLLGTCSSGRSVSMCNELDPLDLEDIAACKEGSEIFLGRCIRFDELPELLQQHVLTRVSEG